MGLDRKPWYQYFLDIAKTVATRSTCSRLSVGAVAVRDRQILATGYNGAPKGHPHCDHTGSTERCQVSIHAEANVIAQAARNGVCLDGATVYVTHLPCPGCIRLMVNAGIRKAVYGEVYGNPEASHETARACGLEVLCE